MEKNSSSLQLIICYKYLEMDIIIGFHYSYQIIIMDYFFFVFCRICNKAFVENMLTIISQKAEDILSVVNFTF